MNPIMPSSASNNGAVDSAHQNAACELIPNSESPHALLRVRSTILRQRCRTRGGGTATGPVPLRCHGTVSDSAGDDGGRASTAVSSALLSLPTAVLPSLSPWAPSSMLPRVAPLADAPTEPLREAGRPRFCCRLDCAGCRTPAGGGRRVGSPGGGGALVT